MHPGRVPEPVMTGEIAVREMAVRALSTAALLGCASAVPGLNTTHSSCPSAYGPGLHTIRMQVPDVDDPTFICKDN